MGTPINRGDDNPQLQKQNYGFDFHGGAEYSEDWKGINQSKMITKYNGTVFTTSRSTLSLSNSMAEARFEWKGSSSGGGTSAKELTIDRWEIPEPKVEKPLVSHPSMYNAFYILGGCSGGTGQTDVDIGSYMAKFQEGISGNQKPGYFTGTTPGWFQESNFPGWTAFLSTYSSLAQYVFRQYQKCLNGQTHYQDSTYSVRHTTVAPAYWSANVSDSNVNCIYTLTQLLSELQSSYFWYYPLPGRLAYKISAASSQLFNDLPSSVQSKPGYVWGWLKSPFGEASTGRNQIEIQGSYVLDLWPTDIYPTAS